MSKLSRRSFLKGTAVSALGAAALGMTACSNNTAASSTASSAAASAPASSTPAQQPASAETGKPSFFTDPYQYKDTDAVQVVTTEVVVVGAGNAGCTAACSCVENGSEVVVIEAQNAIHGQGGGVGLCNTKYVQSLVDEGKLPHMTDVVEHQNIWVQRCDSRVNEALVSMWFNNSPEAGNWLIDKCAEFGVVPVSFRAHAPNAIIPESYDYHMFVNVGDHQFDNEGTWVQSKSMNVMHQTGNVAWSIFDADYGKCNRMSLENGTGGDMEVTVTITDGKISDIVVNSHAESSDIGAPALDKLIQNAIAANSAEIDGASGATMTSDGFREAVAQALAKAQ